jgi:hypothetical protein
MHCHLAVIEGTAEGQSLHAAQAGDYFMKTITTDAL